MRTRSAAPRTTNTTTSPACRMARDSTLARTDAIVSAARGRFCRTHEQIARCVLRVLVRYRALRTLPSLLFQFASIDQARRSLARANYSMRMRLVRFLPDLSLNLEGLPRHLANIPVSKAREHSLLRLLMLMLC